MKNFILGMTCIGFLILALYSTNTFKAFFLSDTFYQNICNTTFDVSQKGAEIELPLKHDYNAPHELNFAVPAK